MTDGRSRSFASLLRAGLPVRWGDWLTYLLTALALRFLLGFSLAATFVTLAVAIPVSILAFAAGRYALGRTSPAADAEEAEADDGG